MGDIPAFTPDKNEVRFTHFIFAIDVLLIIHNFTQILNMNIKTIFSFEAFSEFLTGQAQKCLPSLL